ncbi:hypothetical protein C8J56DRAFT_931569 [Mycena floridula]|nr:hypothetical protein C8J56DRAFT_931569 [Mycena floridula]
MTRLGVVGTILEHSVLLATLRSSFPSRVVDVYPEKFYRYRSTDQTTHETCLISAILPTTSICRLNNGCRSVIFQDPLQANRLSGATVGYCSSQRFFPTDFFFSVQDMDIVSRLFFAKVLRPFSEVREKLSAALPLKPGDEENLEEMASRGRRR